MRWSNIFEAIISAPSIILGEIIKFVVDIWQQEKELAKHGEYDEEEIEYEKEEHLGKFKD